jgi:hypothetical protein
MLARSSVDGREHGEMPKLPMAGEGMIEIRQVLAAAYGGTNMHLANGMLTHAVEVDANGNETRVLCGRVKLESICDMNVRGQPTCPVCARKLPKEKR